MSSLLGEVDQIVFSPPFANRNKGGGIAVKGYEGEYGKDEKLIEGTQDDYQRIPNNIDNIKSSMVSTKCRECQGKNWPLVSTYEDGLLMRCD